MHELVGQGLGPRTQRESWDQLGGCVTRHPEPGGFGRAVNLQMQFVELNMR